MASFKSDGISSSGYLRRQRLACAAAWYLQSTYRLAEGIEAPSMASGSSASPGMGIDSPDGQSGLLGDQTNLARVELYVRAAR
jgi:hypothetical protein